MIPSKTTLIAALGVLSLAGASVASGASGAEPASKALFPDLPMALADYDGDGRLDALALAADGTPRLLHNLGAAGFEDATDASGLTAVGAAQGASWHDIDGDGRVDLTLFTPAGGVRVLYNLDGAFFAEGTEGSGLEHARGVRAARWTDLDGDGLSELWTASDSGERLWRNFGDGFFVELPLPEAGTGGSGTFYASGPGGYSIHPAPGNPQGPGLSSLPGPDVLQGVADVLLNGTFCMPRIADQAGGCLEASSTPTPGKLFTFSTSTIPGLSADRIDGLDSSSFSQLGSSIEGDEITDNTIQSTDIQNESITGADIKNGTITSLEIKNATITGADIALGSIHGNNLTDGTVGYGEIASGAISTIHLSNGAVTHVTLSVDSVSGSKVQDGSLTGADLAPSSVGASHIGVAAVGSSHIATDAVGQLEIAANAVGAAEIAAGAVGTAEIAPNAINSNHIQSGSINSTDIQDGQVGASDLALFSITDSNISGSAAISGTKIVSHFGAQDLTTDNRLGVGTVLPLEDLHVVGSSTMGTALITPDATTGQDSELILGEIDDGSYGMRMAYDGGTNTMSLGGVNAGVHTTHWRLTRDSGRMGIGTAPISDTRVYIDDDNRWGVRVKADSTYSGATYGVSADNSNLEGIGVYGQASNPGAVSAGVQGECSSPLGFGVASIGTFVATGAKLFTQPHPQDAGREVRFVCLEGNESGTYFRGSSKLVGGEAIIDVPEDFRLVTEADGMTVQVTAMGLPAALYVVSKDLDQIVVRGHVDVDFDYFVNGVRRGYGEFETMAENRFFVPTERGVPFGTQYPDAVRQILVNNGTLHPDFTPNEATAAAQGWVLRDPAPTGPAQAQEAPVD